MENVLASSVSALVGVIVGAALSWLKSDLDKKMDTTFEFHREFFSRELVVVRSNAHSYLIERLNAGETPDLRTLHRDERQDPRAHDVWNIAEFYERLAIAVDHRRVKRNLVGPLFGQTFVYWHVNFFEPELADKSWDLRERLERLARFLQKNELRHFRKWKEDAPKELERVRHVLRNINNGA